MTDRVLDRKVGVRAIGSPVDARPRIRPPPTAARHHPYLPLAPPYQLRTEALVTN